MNPYQTNRISLPRKPWATLATSGIGTAAVCTHVGPNGICKVFILLNISYTIEIIIFNAYKKYQKIKQKQISWEQKLCKQW